MMSACTQTKNPFLQEWDTPYGIPPFDKITLADYIPAVKAGIEQQEKELQAILDNKETPTFKNTVEAYELSGEILSKVNGVLFNLQETEGSDEMEKVAEEATELLTTHENEISMNRKCFERLSTTLTRAVSRGSSKWSSRISTRASPATEWIWMMLPRQGSRRST